MAKGKPQNRTIVLSDGTKIKATDNNKNALNKKSVYTRAQKDPEDGPSPRDKASKHKYPPPKKNPEFRKTWMRFIDNLTSRDNFNPGHLDLLEILCDLYVEMHQLTKYLRTHGRNYKVITVTGEIWRTYPEVTQLAKIREQIQQYSKHLDLFPKKDHGPGGGDPHDEDEWK